MAVDLNIFIQRVDDLKDFVDSIAGQVLMGHADEIIAMNNAQLMAGQNIKGKVMQRGYSNQYAKRRQKAGLQTGKVDLRFTGKYQDTKRAVPMEKGGLAIISDADYEVYLRGNFPDHVGLNKKNAEIISKKIEKELATEIKTFLTK